MAEIAIADGRIVGANRAWLQQLDTSPAGHTLYALFPDAANLIQQPPGAPGRRALRLAPSRGGAATWWDLDTAPHPETDSLLLVTARDATDRVLARREAEDARDALEPIGSRLRLAQEAAGIGTWEWDAAADALAWSPEQFRLHGLDPAAGTPPRFGAWVAMLHPDDQIPFRTAMAGPKPGETPAHQMEFRVRRADTGEERWLLLRGRVMAADAAGRVTRMLGVNIDITERRAEQDALRENSARLRLAAEAARVHAWDWEVATGKVTWSPGLEAELGLPPGGFGGTLEAFRALVHPDDLPLVERAIHRALSGEVADYRAEFRMRRVDGTIRWSENRATLLRDHAGQPVLVVGMDHDITDLKATEAALHARERQQAAVAALGQFALRTASSHTVIEQAVRVLAETLQVEFVKVLKLLPGGQQLRLLAGIGWNLAYPVGVATISAGRESQAGYTLLQDAGPVIVEDLAADTRFDGPRLLKDHGIVSGISVVIRAAGDTSPPFGVLGVHTATPRRFTEHDIRFLEAVANIVTASIQREQNETSLLRRKAALRGLVEAMPQFTFTATPDGRTEYKNRRWCDYSGLSIDHAMGHGWVNQLHPEDRDATVAAWSQAVATGEPFEWQHRLLGKEGQYRWFLTRAIPERAADDGRILRWLGTSTDVDSLVQARDAAVRRIASLEGRVTERTRALSDAARELGAEMRRRHEAQSALQQSQKLEALGQLTAGVAHDFNNLLSAILGSFELIAKHSRQPSVTELAGHGKHAGDRAASLIRQLLDFGRQSAGVPVVIDLASALPAAEPLIAPALGSGINRVLDLQPDIWPVLADAHQLEVALLNLAINARDAMPDGGTLTLGARNLAPAERPNALPLADYVAICVRDTGKGMPPAVIARAAEPFFTTKAVGKGTGLGLPMVHAFAERSGGCLRLESSPGAGTLIEIILPRAAATEMPLEAPTRSAEAAEPVGGLTILLVDDDDQLRQITAEYLRAQSYTVIEAPTAEAAIVLSHSIETLDLLLTDVSMPGASGPQLAARMRTERPNLRVLFITGQGDQDGFENEAVLQKPITGAAVVDAIRQLIPAAVSGGEGGALLRRLRSPELMAAYLFWRAARNGDRPPRLPDLNWGGLPEAANAFVVAVEPAGNVVDFRFIHVGSALEARLGRRLTGALTSEIGLPQVNEEVLGSLEGSYRRCARTLSPSYEYASYDFGDGAPTMFERLTLPVADDADNITHLVGIALFS